MLEQQHLAQERLVIAAQERKLKSTVYQQSRPSRGWWQPYVMTFIFGVALLGSHFIYVSNLGHRLIYIVIIMLYYGWLWHWVRADTYSQQDNK